MKFKLALVILMFSAQNTVFAEDLNEHPKAQITKAEFLKKAESRFNKMDTNADGVLTKDEHKAARVAMRDHHKEHRQHKESADH